MSYTRAEANNDWVLCALVHDVKVMIVSGAKTSSKASKASLLCQVPWLPWEWNNQSPTGIDQLLNYRQCICHQNEILAAVRSFCPQRQCLPALVVDFFLNWTNCNHIFHTSGAVFTSCARETGQHPNQTALVTQSMCKVRIVTHLDNQWITGTHVKHRLPSPCVSGSAGSFPKLRPLQATVSSKVA